MDIILQPIRGWRGTCEDFKTRYHITRFGVLKDISSRSVEDELEKKLAKGQTQFSPFLPFFLQKTYKSFP